MAKPMPLEPPDTRTCRPLRGIRTRRGRTTTASRRRKRKRKRKKSEAIDRQTTNTNATDAGGRRGRRRRRRREATRFSSCHLQRKATVGKHEPNRIKWVPSSAHVSVHVGPILRMENPVPWSSPRR
ncbi:hypothetical protein B296_00016690 [Ensete ventricosum]|uniref:Uncharacterized protein n=1 Tax=Ensete ventricosum TaxID=4639 RepID=A0A427AWL6_ENSVE|nr:hypothetical protein B296_00016690 [Ensete ventricosum]